MIRIEGDPWFNEGEVLSRIKNLWMQLLSCRANWDPEPMEPYFSGELYARLTGDIGKDGEDGIKRQAGRPAVLDGTLEKREGGEKDTLVCRLFTRYNPREVHFETGKVLKEGKETFFQEEWVLTRPAGVKTPVPGAPFSVNCPSCGAPFSMYKSAKCPMCGSAIRVPDFVWTVEDIIVKEG